MKKLITTLTILLITASSCFLYGQDLLSDEQEFEIKMSEKYYWDQCTTANVDEAKMCASDGLCTQVILDAVSQTIKMEEILKAIERTGINFNRLRSQQKDRVTILAWIAKDSIFVTTRRSVTQMSASGTQQAASESSARQTAPTVKNEALPATTSSSQPITQQTAASTTATASTSKTASTTNRNPVVTDNPVLKELIACQNLRDVLRIVRNNGLVPGRPDDFSNPEKCIIAVFTADGILSALLDTGSSSRTDLLTGKSIQNPEQHYSQERYIIWYLFRHEK